jgi:DNA-binding LytR/AlgR family response regulator
MKSILLIEDDEYLRENISEILKNEGYFVKLASSGLSGLRALSKQEFDIIICDIMMPQMDGYEVLKAVKSRSTDVPPTFIFLTAKTERSDLRYGMELGADDFITKPFTRDDIIKSIKSQLDKRDSFSKKYNIEKEIIGLISEKGVAGKSLIKTKTKLEKEILYEGSIFLSDNKRSDFVKVSNVVYISASKDYSKIFTKDAKSYIVRKPLKNWEERLPKEHFIRIHRSTIINNNYIENVEKWFNYSYKLHLTGVKEPFIISQRYSRKLKYQIKTL